MVSSTKDTEQPLVLYSYKIDHLQEQMLMQTLNMQIIKQSQSINKVNFPYPVMLVMLL